MANYIKDSKAPYNFIRLPINAFIKYESSEKLPGYGSFDKNLKTGYIEYEFTNETPIFVGGEKDKNNEVKFFVNSSLKYCIPGSTMRGVIRKNTEILGFGFPEFIEDNLFLYRKFAATGAVKKEYINAMTEGSDCSLINNIKAGYIYKDEKGYYLVPAKEVNKKTFFSIKEVELRRMNLPEGKDKVQYMYTKEILNFKYTKEKEKEREKEWETWTKDNKNKSYKPYTVKIKFNIDKENHITNISLCNSNKSNGILLNSNSIDKKKNHYIINEMGDLKERYELGETQILAYRNDCDSNKQRKNPDFYKLPKDNGIKYAKPFFYKTDANNNVIYFGKCPYLRIFYDKSVRKLIKTGFTYGIDYPNAIYGYTVDKDVNLPTKNEEHNFKGRVSFTDAVCDRANVIKDKKFLILSSPKPTSYPNYLYQFEVEIDDDLYTYNNSNSEIRGYKFYWMKDFDINKFNSIEPKQEKVATKIKNVLDKNNRFRGRVYFENLTDDELGLLLLSLNYKKGVKESIGMAKPYGFGRVNINRVKLYIDDINKRFLGIENSISDKTADIEKYKAYYKSFINERFAELEYNASFEDIDEINDYILSKTKIMKPKEVEYMNVKAFKEYTSLPLTYQYE